MRALSASEILRVWEQGSHSPALERALLLLSGAGAGESWEELSALPLGVRDRRLLELRAASFGPELPFFARCPSCGADVDFTLPAAQLLPGGAEVERSAFGEHELRTGNAVVRFRLPDSRDLAEAGGRAAHEAEQVLLR